jgi:uncharacterized membrane protein YqjE
LEPVALVLYPIQAEYQQAMATHRPSTRLHPQAAVAAVPVQARQALELAQQAEAVVAQVQTAAEPKRVVQEIPRLQHHRKAITAQVTRIKRLVVEVVERLRLQQIRTAQTEVQTASVDLASLTLVEAAAVTSALPHLSGLAALVAVALADIAALTGLQVRPTQVAVVVDRDIPVEVV